MYDHIPHNSIVVQKYGGTSVGNVERIQEIAARTARFKANGWNNLAIVVSAMAGETNRLVGLVDQLNPGSRSKAYDIAVAAGEQVSVGLVSAALEKVGIAAEPLLGYQLGIVTDPKHGKAKIHSINIERILTAWSQGAIPVIAGFQGVTSDMAITTLGRGGSDTSAVALAVALNASFCEINTDVDGVFTADPRYVPKAQLMQKMDYETALELAASGGKVLHSRCVEIGAKYKMPIVVRNSFSKDETRSTWIMPINENEALESPVVSGVTVDRDVAKITIRNWSTETGSILDVFSKLAEAGVNVDIIVYDKPENNKLSVGLTVPKSDLPSAQTALSQFPGIQLESLSGLAKVSAVGLGMRSHSGVASRIFEALAKDKIEILMISTSEIKISCVLEESLANQATQRIHDLFF